MSLVLAPALAYAALLSAKILLALRRGAPPPGTAVAPSTTIVQPILGGDPALSDVLARNLRALPHCRFLWLLDTDDAVGRDVAQGLCERLPDVAITCLVLPPAPAGHNPKMHKLALAQPYLATPHFVVLDDDTELPAASLAALLAALDDADLATGLPCYLDDGRFASRLLAQFVDNNAALTYLPLLNFWPPPSINGMGYALRGDAFARMGGFAPLTRQLTDDLAVARRLQACGGRIVQSTAPLFVRTSVRDLRHYAQLLHRWFLFALLLLQHQPSALRASILLLHGLPPLLLWTTLVAAAVATRPAALVAIAALLALRSVGLRAVQRHFTGATRHRFAPSLIAELLQPLHALHALLQRRIRWRTRHYRVHTNDDFEPVA
nr:glycosyltransferase [Tahibacter caeni]